MSAVELIEKLQNIVKAAGSTDVDVVVDQIGYDRYGYNIGLKAGDKVLLESYVCGDMPLW